MTNGKGKGGGVLIAVRSTIKNETVNMTAFNDINCVCVKLIFQKGNLFIYNGYVPPKDKSQITYNRHIDAIKSIRLDSQDKLKVLGDFNLPGIGWLLDEDFQSYYPTSYNCDLAEYFLDELMALGLFQYSNIANKCGNVLDYVLLSEPCAIDIHRAPSTLTAVAEKSENDDRFHYPIEWEIEFENRIAAKTARNNDPIRSFKRAEFDQISQFWSNFDVNLIHSKKFN